jgi:hypothetical protein
MTGSSNRLSARRSRTCPVLRRPDSRDEFELALGEAMTALLRSATAIWCVCAARAMAAWRRDFVAGTRALAIRKHEAYGSERYNKAYQMA